MKSECSSCCQHHWTWPGVCPAGSCPQSRPCCRSPFRRRPRSTSVCQWRTRSCSGSFITETSAAPTRCPHSPPPPPSNSSPLAAPASSPAPPSHPDNSGPWLPGSRAILISFSQTLAPRSGWTDAFCPKMLQTKNVAQEHFISKLALLFAFDPLMQQMERRESQDLDVMEHYFCFCKCWSLLKRSTCSLMQV